MKKILISRRLPDPVLEAANARFDVTLRDDTSPMTPVEMVKALGEFDGILPTLGDMFTSDVFASAPNPRAKILANFGVGYNHIDLVAAKEAGLVVTNTPGAVTDATADIALTLMLMSARRAAEGERLVRSGTWQGWHPTQMLGLHMSGKILGVIGMGRIGKAIAKRAHFGFGMDVIFYNRSHVADTEVPAGQLDRVSDVMAAADIVVVAVPGSPATHHLIDAQALGMMQPHAHLINISRGDVVDEAALISALKSNQIGGAGLDVYEHEPQVPDALRALDNVTLLPHLGTAALEVRTDMGHMAVGNLVDFFDGKPSRNEI
ncbi:2-hydroxyacid dehydrogenase [Halocynthiibacter namhaensis]|uniref:2-hydroxyacid dehydrogenase n=1 Tax=Halocynthiibacter namhaensis TaxID=1290553 RepID=UPI0005799AB6|nr:D-glycerate dehydrogenase [Halocynthiibacter namhaensis]